MNSKKVSLGQYFTKGDTWILKHILKFIKNSGKKAILDPYAGEGHILDTLKCKGFEDAIGYDIDEELIKDKHWKKNDGLKFIEATDRIIITNPPYLAKNSAKRKNAETYNYFENNKYEDLYQIALEKCLENHEYVVAIIPETFILNMTKAFKKRLFSVTILENNPFEDTDCPVCVVCFNNKQNNDAKIYKDGKNLKITLSKLEKRGLHPAKSKDVCIKFNDKNGNIGLRGVDGTGNVRIGFCKPDELGYDLDRIGISSRSITVINISVPKIYKEKDYIQNIIDNANNILKDYRENTYDLLMAPFKGNTKSGTRRRRLDFKTARAILEQAILLVKEGEDNV